MHQIVRPLPVAVIGSEDLYHAVRGALVARGTSLSSWCKTAGLNRQTVEKALKGERRSRAADELRKRVISEVLSERAP